MAMDYVCNVFIIDLPGRHMEATKPKKGELFPTTNEIMEFFITGCRGKHHS